MGVIRVTGRLICATAEEAALVEDLLDEHIRLSRAEPGCLRFNVVRSASDPMVWELDEVEGQRMGACQPPYCARLHGLARRLGPFRHVFCLVSPYFRQRLGPFR